MARFLHNILLTAFCSLACVAHAEELSTEPEKNVEESYLTPDENEDYEIEPLYSSDDESIFGFLNTPHSAISESVEVIAKYMDVFFADEKIYQESTKSYAVLSAYSITDENSETQYAGDLRIKLDLPKTKKKLKLVIESDTDQELQSGFEHVTGDTPKKAATESSYYAALQRALKKQGEWKLYSSLGIKLRTPLDPFIRIRAKRHISFDEWNLNFTQSFFWFQSLGAGTSSLLEFDRTFYDNLLFRSATTAIWRNQTDDFELSQSFSLFHEISDRRAISYTIASFGTSEPTVHATSYLFNIRYRQRIHKDWLYAELRPEIVYERENDFHPEPSLIFQIDMVFGDKYLK